ncbi:MAG: carboxypeptidase-like regulatory domain-containing protein, partial [Psychroserpens sp.]|nr:carboxypeptidase-like regulatory domain-containing protein [Psychroserpens sp.]
MKIVRAFVIVFLFISGCLGAQSLRGVVLDAQTKTPIESAAIYFDNTSIGTSTNNKGEFEIELKEGITSALVISFLGYQRYQLEEYVADAFYEIYLEESIDTLDEVVISADDGMTREMKLNLFRTQFLGFSKLSRSCTILNEDDIVLRYKKSTKELSASTKVPIRIRNEGLQYIVHFDIKQFVIEYTYVDIPKEQFNIKGVSYTGTTFYKSLVDDNDKRIRKKRENAYKGSVLHFMRALSQDRIEEEGFHIYSSGFRVKPSNYIFTRDVEGYPGYVNVSFLRPLNVVYKR